MKRWPHHLEAGLVCVQLIVQHPPGSVRGIGTIVAQLDPQSGTQERLMLPPMHMDRCVREARQLSGAIEMQERQHDVVGGLGGDSLLRRPAHCRCFGVTLQAEGQR
jgi:hypothetical protein